MTQPKPSINLPATGFVRVKDVLKVFPVSKSTWWLGIQDGRFPKPVKLSARITAWRVEDIRNLIDAKANYLGVENTQQGDDNCHIDDGNQNKTNNKKKSIYDNH